MSINLLGLEEGFDIPLAVLNTIKGESQRANHRRLSIEPNSYFRSDHARRYMLGDARRYEKVFFHERSNGFDVRDRSRWVDLANLTVKQYQYNCLMFDRN